jgi:16S rRNA (guanine966-N2)-methyltransferase
MRVVAGSARGRPLVAPDGSATRPTSDRVREATFNALGSLDAVVDATVVDLFAGSGALGVEALSRGAAHATFVERDRRALAAIRANLETTGLGERATVLGDDGIRALGRVGACDLVLADPPYAFDDWPRLLDAVPSGALVVIESDRPVELPSTWASVRQKRYGGTLVLIARKPVDHPPNQAFGATPPDLTE